MINNVIRRSRQFFRAIFSKMEPIDHAFVSLHLNEVEKQLFYNMDRAVQKHCVNVARTAMQMAESASEMNLPLLTKGALLHDIGKTRGSLTIIDRVIYVILHRISPRLVEAMAQPRAGLILARLRNAFHVHLTHGATGAIMARETGLSEDLIYLLKNHHNKKLKSSSSELLTLFQADEVN